MVSPLLVCLLLPAASLATCKGRSVPDVPRTDAPASTRAPAIVAHNVTTSTSTAPPAAHDEPTSTSNSSYTALNDPPRLFYKQPASVWTEALPVGNGRIAAMVWGGTASEKLSLNEETLWSGGPYDPVNAQAHNAIPQVRQLILAGKYAEAQTQINSQVLATPRSEMAFQPVGTLTLDMSGVSGTASDYVRQLDLDAAVATTSFTIGGAKCQRDVFASPEDQVIAVHTTCDKAFDLAVGLQSQQSGAAISIDDATLTLTGRNGGGPSVPGKLTFTARARVSSVGGNVSKDASHIRVSGAKEVTVLLAMATSYRSYNDVSGNPNSATLADLERASGREIIQLREATSTSHRALFRRVTLDLGRSAAADTPTDERIKANSAATDAALMKLYFDYGRYLLISSSRQGTQPANLQGAWNDNMSPPWGSKYTININTEMNYWPAEVTGLSECIAPLINMVTELAVTGARTAKAMYGAGGWVAHHNTDAWRASAPIDIAGSGMWPTGGAWLSTHLWDRYDYSRDLTYLAQVYPIMKGAAQFFLDTLQSDGTSGKLVTNPSLSPEHDHPGGGAVCAGPAMDQQILRDLFDQVAQAAALLNTDTSFASQVMAARTKLAPDQVGAQGQLQEWQQDWDATAPDRHHRHVSHLYGLFPSDQINLDDTPALAKAARVSLVNRGDESTGWATAWRANLWARLREGDHAHKILAYLLGPDRTYPNMFDAHPPFQIDGNFGGTRAIAEMLMQSRGDEILLLPALPSAWPSGSITGLRARGRCTVDLHWQAGTLTQAVIRPEIDGKRTIRLGTQHVEIALTAGTAVTLSGASLSSGGGGGRS